MPYYGEFGGRDKNNNFIQKSTKFSNNIDNQEYIHFKE